MVLYTNNVPQATQTIAFTQPIIQSNFQYLPLWASADHYFPSDSADAANGFHNKVTFRGNIGAPGFGSGVSAMYVDAVNGQSFPCFQNAAGSYAMNCINPSVSATEGYTSLPGGLIMQFGKKLNAFPSDSGTGTVNYPKTFFNRVLYINCIAIDNSGSGTGRRISIRILPGYDSSLGFFDYSYGKSSSTADFTDMLYMAIGV